MNTKKSPYLREPDRLADVIAAIPIMGQHKERAQLEVAEWARRLKEPRSAKSWGTVFSEHPEFFVYWEDESDRTKKWAMLRWRHSYNKTYDPRVKNDLKPDQLKELTPEERENLTEKTLTIEQVEALMRTAIEMHSRAVAHAQETRWLTPLLFGLLGVILGAILK